MYILSKVFEFFHFQIRQMLFTILSLKWSKHSRFFFHEKIVLVDNTERQLQLRPAFEDIIIRSWNEFPAIKKLFSLSLFARLNVLFILTSAVLLLKLWLDCACAKFGAFFGAYIKLSSCRFFVWKPKKLVGLIFPQYLTIPVLASSRRTFASSGGF